MSTKWRNITEQIFALSKELEFLDTVMHPDITLEETMHAHEINDPKIDPKFDINISPNLNQMIENGTIKAPQTLTLKDLKNIYTEIFKLQTLVLQGNPLPQTIYTFNYLYHDDLSKKSSILEPLIESLHTFGAYVFEIHKESCLIKEDDLNFSNFSFKKNVRSHDEISEMFIKAQKQVDSLIKAQKDVSLQQEGKEIQAFMKLRRSLHLLAKSLGLVYDSKNQNKIDSQMKTARKRLAQLQALIKKNNLKQQLPQGVFSPTINKFLRSHFNNRQVKSLTLEQSFNQLKNALDQFDLFLPPSTRITQYKYKLDVLSYKPINLWSKSYIKYNLFHKESYLLNTIKSEDAFVSDIQQWSHLTQQLKNDEGFLKFVQLSTPSLLETLYRMSSRNSRWFWQISKSYEDMNVMVHLSNELTSKYSEKKKEIHLTSWLYNWGTATMARQIIWGFEEDLYEISEYHYVTYYLDYVLYVNERNNDLFLANKLDKSILENYYDGTLGKSKQKKKLGEVERVFLSDAMFKKGLHFYFRALNRIMFVLLNRKLIFDPFENSLELKFSNRFRIFKNALFIRKLTYETYKQQLDNVAKDEGKIIDQAMDLLKKAKNIFGLFHQFQENETFINQKEDAQILQKLSVKLSLVVMTLKMKQNKKFIIRKDHPRYPQIQIQ